MTTLPPALHLTTVDSEDTVRIEITGDLDYDHAGHLLDEVTAQLGSRPHLTDLHLHCAGVGTVDSTGLSVLLMIRRRTTAVGARLHLDDRTAMLDRLLDITGTLEYLTETPPPAAAPSHQHGTEPLMTKGTAQADRPTGPDSTT
ncbi:STAS domain-containing protein [Streptomyces sp. NPDC059766]|uniref:STAS domain-containing protein n=1 Tax=Streptomyces sp. NPDC059766 TaxID=3346940 RepID=UPI003650726A